MNLVSDGWVPVISEDGNSTLVSLDTLFRDAECIRDLIANPPQRIALMRLLICITQAALDGPEDEEDWVRCRNRIGSSSREYLAKWQHRFELYGEQPFLQIAALRASEKDVFKTPLDKMDIDLATASRHVLFDREAASSIPRTHSAAAIALSLVTFQSFGLGGGKSTRASWGQVDIDGSANSTTNNNYTAGPCTGSRLFVMLGGDTLAETIHLNLVPKFLVREGMPSVRFGKPVWEVFPSGYATERSHEMRGEYLAWLVPLSRFLILDPADSSYIRIVTNGYSYPSDPSSFRDPMLTVIPTQDGDGNESLGYLAARPGRHPWRDLHAVLALASEAGPLVLQHLRAAGAMSPERCVCLWAGALLNEQAKPIEGVEWRLHFPLDMLKGTAARVYSHGVDLAAHAESRLRQAITLFFAGLDVPEFRLRNKGTFVRNDNRSRQRRESTFAKSSSHFWSTLDTRYEALIRIACSDTLGLDDGWRQTVESAMRDAYAFACPHVTPRQIQAYVRGLRVLRLKRTNGN